MSVLRACLSAHRRLASISTCERSASAIGVNAVIVACCTPRRPRFCVKVARGFFFACAWLRGGYWRGVKLFVDRVAVVVARGGGVLWHVIM